MMYYGKGGERNPFRYFVWWYVETLDHLRQVWKHARERDCVVGKPEIQFSQRDDQSFLPGSAKRAIA